MLKSAAPPRIVIIGAGFSGIGLGIELKKAGIDTFTILERGDGIGGCWRAQYLSRRRLRYSLAAVQLQFRSQTQTGPVRIRQAREIRDYIERCAKKFDVTPHVRPHVTVSAIRREGARWLIETEAGEKITADIVVPALGPLSDPKLPRIEGIETFTGAMFHSARWDHSQRLDGRKVGIIGSAASAAQIIPEIAPIAKDLTVFMRTPNWVIPRNDFPIHASRKRWRSTRPCCCARSTIALPPMEKNYAFLQRGSVRGRQLGNLARRGMQAQVPDGRCGMF